MPNFAASKQHKHKVNTTIKQIMLYIDSIKILL